MKNAVIHLGARVFMIFPESGGPPIGTGFNIERPGLVLTAAHVVENQKYVLITNTFKPTIETLLVTKIIRHPKADVAALFLPDGAWKDMENFKIGIPRSGYRDFPVGTEIASYGYPMIGGEQPIPARYMKGHIQRKFEYKKIHYQYQAFELGFPAFAGQSGSPVFLDDVLYASDGRNQAVGIVTESVVYETEEEEKSTVRWAIAASLLSLREWLEDIDELKFEHETHE